MAIQPESEVTGSLRRRMPRLVLISLVLGTVIRLAAIPLSSAEYSLPFWEGYGWPADHGNYVQWARQATAPEYGLWTMYTTPPEREVRVVVSQGELFTHHGNGEIANYPPLGIYLVYVQGFAHRWLDPNLTVNTAVARAVFDTFALVGDIVLAWGVWALGLTLFDRRKAAIAFAITYLMPPIWLDSCWWGQTDSWVLAPIVWTVWAMAQRRWLSAGVLWGIGLALKPQAVLVVPLWGFAWCVAQTRAFKAESGTAPSRDAWRIVAAVALGIVVLNIIALPFWFTSGDAWFYQSYLRNLTEEAPHTTLRAFNVWYVDLLLTYDTDVTVTIAGLTKDTWGKLLTLAAFAGVSLASWRTPVPASRRVVVLAGLWLLVTVMFPTRVHERYIVLCLPFLALVATGFPRWRAGVIGLVVVACLQVTVYQWLSIGTDAWSRTYKDDAVAYYEKAVRETPPEHRHLLPATVDDALALGLPDFIQDQRSYRPYEWGATILALLSAGLTFYAAARADPVRREPVDEPDAAVA